MAKYLQISAAHVSQLTVKFNKWFMIQPIETGDSRWVIPVRALKEMREAVLPVLKDTINRNKLIQARNYLEAMAVLDEVDITWKINDETKYL